MSIQRSNIDLSNKKVLVLGAGGVVPSIIYALTKMHVKKIIVSNRTKDKADHLKTFFKDIDVIDWGKLSDFDMIINATSIGLKKGDKINLDFALIGTNKYFFDVIYNLSLIHI